MARANHGAEAFFIDLARAFDATITSHLGQAQLVGALCAQAFDTFERNLVIQAEGLPALACKGECPYCCSLRVVATAPEIFLLARFVAANSAAFLARGVALVDRIGVAEAAIGGLSQERRLAARHECPFVHAGLCLCYRMRPLACRGHASFDKDACRKALAGDSNDTPVSTPHLVVRSLVQNAMMSALRNQKMGWGLYELNRALHIALSIPAAEARWIVGDDPLAHAAISDFDAQEAGATFDSVRVTGGDPL
jgi:hypothetical protein